MAEDGPGAKRFWKYWLFTELLPNQGLWDLREQTHLAWIERGDQNGSSVVIGYPTICADHIFSMWFLVL